MKKIVAAAFLLFSVTALSGEIDLDAAVKMALSNNTDIIKSEKDLQSAKSLISQASKVILPSLSYSGSYTRNDKNLVPGNDDSVNYFSHTLSIDQNIFAGGMEYAGMEIANISEKLANVSLESKKREIKVKVESDYLNVIKAARAVKLVENALNEIKINYKKMEEMYNLKMVSKTNLLEIKYRISELESTLMGAAAGYDIAKINFKSTIGYTDSDEMTLKEIDVDSVKKAEYNIADDIKYAQENKSTIKLIEYQKKIKKEEINIVNDDLMPKIGLKGNYIITAYKPEESINVNNSKWNISIGFQMKLWDWGATGDKAKQKEAEQKKLDYDTKSALNGIEVAVRAAYSEMDKLSKMIDSKTEALESTKENYAIEKEKLDMKMTTANDFLAAENLLRKAETELFNAKIDYYIAVEKYKNTVEREAN